LTLLFTCISACIAEQASCLDNGSSQRLKAFVASVDNKSSNQFVASADSIVVFNNNGILWAEQPAYFQRYVALDQIKVMAAVDPTLAQQWQDRPLSKQRLMI
tara:strand:- start:210 stop:515 length:306 start_codon:yes stop_codon:yes gene_type:complete